MVCTLFMRRRLLLAISLGFLYPYLSDQIHPPPYLHPPRNAEASPFLPSYLGPSIITAFPAQCMVLHNHDLPPEPLPENSGTYLSLFSHVDSNHIHISQQGIIPKNPCIVPTYLHINIHPPSSSILRTRQKTHSRGRVITTPMPEILHPDTTTVPLSFHCTMYQCDPSCTLGRTTEPASTK
jgi:hypothetical protein